MHHSNTTGAKFTINKQQHTQIKQPARKLQETANNALIKHNWHENHKKQATTRQSNATGATKTRNTQQRIKQTQPARKSQETINNAPIKHNRHESHKKQTTNQTQPARKSEETSNNAQIFAHCTTENNLSGSKPTRPSSWKSSNAWSPAAEANTGAWLPSLLSPMPWPKRASPHSSRETQFHTLRCCRVPVVQNYMLSFNAHTRTNS